MKTLLPIKPVKAMLSGLLAMGSTLAIAACYGPVENTQNTPRSIYGTVTTRLTGQGIQGIEVCAVAGGSQKCSFTDGAGSYDIDIDPSWEGIECQVCARDTDGAQNGSYAVACRTLASCTDANVDFNLDPVEE